MNPINVLKQNAAAAVTPDREYMAVVVDNNDPERLQRVRVTIPNLLEAAAVDLLPWVQRRTGSFAEGTGDDYGDLCIPRIGARVWVSFQDGDVSFGTYTADTITNKLKLPPELLENYPNRRGWVSGTGDLFYHDLTTKTAKFVHHSGTTLLIQDDGSVVQVFAKDLTQIIKGNYVQQVEGNHSLIVKGSSTFVTEGAFNETRKGGSRLNVSGSNTVSVSGKQTTTCSSHAHAGRMNVAGEVTANGIPLSSHTHPDTGGPLA